MNAAPASLAVGRVMAEPRPGVEKSFFAKAILKIAGYYSKESQQLMAAKAWYSAVTEQIEDSRIYKGLTLCFMSSLEACTTLLLLQTHILGFDQLNAMSRSLGCLSPTFVILYIRMACKKKQGCQVHDCVLGTAHDESWPAAFDLDGEKYRDKYAILCLHMWMTLVRLRKEGKTGKSLTQLIYDNFQEDVEHRVRAAGVKVMHFYPSLCFWYVTRAKSP